LVPVGFSTNVLTAAAVVQVDGLLLAVDSNPTAVTYTLPLATVEQMIDEIARSLEMDPGREFNFDAMKAAAIYLANNNPIAAEAGQVACLVRRGRNIPKMRADGRLQNAPERQQDQDDIRPIRGNRPSLFLFRANGSAGDGWSGQEFYWPVLVAPPGIQPVVFTAEVGD
jgi:hypothetical protein